MKIPAVMTPTLLLAAAGLILTATAHEVKVDTKDVKPPLNAMHVIRRGPVMHVQDHKNAHTTEHHGEKHLAGGSTGESWKWSSSSGGSQSGNCHARAEATTETWIQFLQKYAEKIKAFASISNLSGFAQFLNFASKEQDFPVKPCRGSGGRTVAIMIRLHGVDGQDLEEALKLNKQSKTGGDGWWSLFTKLGTKNQPKEKQVEAQQKVILIIHQNQDVIRKAAVEGNWKLIIELLNKQSKEQGITIDWEQVLGEKGPNSESFRKILLFWSSVNPEKSKTMDLTQLSQILGQSKGPKPDGKPHGSGHIRIHFEGVDKTELENVVKENKESTTGADGWFSLITKLATKNQSKEQQKNAQRKVILIINQNQDVIRKAAAEGNWNLIIQLLQKQTKEQGIDADFSTVLGEKGANNQQIKNILRVWSSSKPEDVKNLDINQWNVRVSGSTHGTKPHPEHPKHPEHPDVHPHVTSTTTTTPRPVLIPIQPRPVVHITPRPILPVYPVPVTTGKPHVHRPTTSKPVQAEQPKPVQETPAKPIVPHDVPKPNVATTSKPVEHVHHPKPVHEGPRPVPVIQPKPVHPEHPKPVVIPEKPKTDNEKPQGSGHVKIHFEGIDEHEVDSCVKQNKGSKTGADGWWSLITKIATKNQSKDKQTTAQNKVVLIIQQNQDVIRKAITEGNWKLIIELLTKESKEQGLDIDFGTVLGDKGTNTELLRNILLVWSTMKPEDAQNLDIKQWTHKVGVCHKPGPHPHGTSTTPQPAPVPTKPGTPVEKSEIDFEGVDEHEIDTCVKKNKDSKTGADGWFYLITKLATKNQPKDKQTDAQQKIILIVNQNQDVIRKAATEGNWKLIIELLTKQSKEQGLDIDFGTVLGGQSKNSHKFKTILRTWSSMKPEEAKNLDIKQWRSRCGNEHVSHPHPVHPDHPVCPVKPNPFLPTVPAITPRPSLPGFPAKVTPEKQHMHAPTTAKPIPIPIRHPIRLPIDKPHVPTILTTTTTAKPNVPVKQDLPKPIVPTTSKPDVKPVVPTQRPIAHTTGKPHVHVPTTAKPNVPVNQLPVQPIPIVIPTPKPSIPNVPKPVVPVKPKPEVKPRYPIPGAPAPKPAPKPDEAKEKAIGVVIEKTGVKTEDLQKAVEINKNSKTGADGWFILITQQAGGETTEEASQKITTIVDQNENVIRQKVKANDWQGLIVFLTEQSKNQGVDIDWSKVLSDESTSSSVWRMILMKWASTESSQAQDMDIDAWIGGDSDLAANRASTIILLIRENQDEVLRLVREKKTAELQLFLEQKAKEKGLEADWGELDLSDKKSEGGQWFKIIKQTAGQEPQELTLDAFFKMLSEQYGGGKGKGSLGDFTSGFNSGFLQQLGGSDGGAGGNLEIVDMMNLLRSNAGGSEGLESLFSSLGLSGSSTGSVSTGGSFSSAGSVSSGGSFGGSISESTGGSFGSGGGINFGYGFGL